MAVQCIEINIWMPNPEYIDFVEGEEEFLDGIDEEIEVEAEVYFSGSISTNEFFSMAQEQWYPGDPGEIDIHRIILMKSNEDITHLISSSEIYRIETECYSTL